MLYLELSKFDEISNDGCIQVLVELLHDFGLINKDPNREGYYVKVDNLEQRRVRIYGDCLSMDKIRHMDLQQKPPNGMCSQLRNQSLVNLLDPKLVH